MAWLSTKSLPARCDLLRLKLNRLLPALLGADADGVFDFGYENLAVTYFSGAGRTDDRLHRRVHLRIGQDDFNFDLRQKVHRVFAAAINLGVALLTAEAFHFGHGHAEQAK